METTTNAMHFDDAFQGFAVSPEPNQFISEADDLRGNGVRIVVFFTISDARAEATKYAGSTIAVTTIGKWKELAAKTGVGLAVVYQGTRYLWWPTGSQPPVVSGG